jgi:hypothetical protein
MWPNSHCKAYVDEKFHALKKSKRWEKRKKKQFIKVDPDS